jgi:hypothetical protein
MLVDGPAVPERVDELARAIAPERVMQRLEHCPARIHGALPDRVGVRVGRVQRPVGAAQGQRRDDAQVRELSTDRQPAVPNDRSTVRTRPPGKVTRLSSTAARTELYQVAAAAGSRVTR